MNDENLSNVHCAIIDRQKMYLTNQSRKREKRVIFSKSHHPIFSESVPFMCFALQLAQKLEIFAAFFSWVGDNVPQRITLIFKSILVLVFPQ